MLIEYILVKIHVHQFAKLSIEENGLFSAFPLIREQFNKCSFAAEQIEKERNKRKKENKEKVDDCFADLACQSVDCVPSSCFRKKSSNSHADNCDIGGCDIIGDCHPFH